MTRYFLYRKRFGKTDFGGVGTILIATMEGQQLALSCCDLAEGDCAWQLQDTSGSIYVLSVLHELQYDGVTPPARIGPFLFQVEFAKLP